MVRSVNAGSFGTKRGFTGVEEQDGSPSKYPYKVLYPNGSLIDNGDGTVTLNLGSSVDKYFVQSFNNVNEIEVTHNLGKYVAVTVIDSADTIMTVAIDYDDVDPTNKVKASWNGNTSGKIFCN